MLEKYKNLRKEIDSLNNNISTTRNSLDDHLDSKDKMLMYLRETEQAYESEIADGIERIKNEYIESVNELYDKDIQEYVKYKAYINKEYVKINAYVNNCGFLDNSDYYTKTDMMKQTLNNIKSIVPSASSSELLKLYSKQGYGYNLLEQTIEHFNSWLKYFEDFDKFDFVMGRVLKVETKAFKQLDNSLVGVGILVILGLIISMKYLTLFPYMVFILITLYLRVKKFYILLQLFGLSGYLDVELKELKDSNDEELKQYILYYDKQVMIKYQLDMERLDAISKGIEEAKKEEIQKVMSDFDYDLARKQAEQNVKHDTDNLQSRIEEETLIIDNLTEKITDMDAQYSDLQNQLRNLREEIKKTYENLIPNFESYQMLDNFFLGFKDEEPVFFNYSKEPALIFYSSMTGELKAVMQTIIMMCGQIMTSMNPLAYTINVVDQLNGGAELSSFEVTSDDEDELESSSLFKVISTTSEVKKMLAEFYEEFNTRRVKVLGSYKNIEEYNTKKLEIGARTLPYKILFLYEYDYKLLANDEMLQQLCRVAKSVGFCLFFMVDISTIEPNNLTDEQKQDYTKIYKYKLEDLHRILNLFNENNIYGFKFTGSDVDIVNTSKKNIISRIR